MKKYGYVRVSSVSQNIDRQMDQMRDVGLFNRSIFIDRQSGKNFEREQYQRLKKRLKAGDLLYIQSIDRLGRNYDMIIEEWADLTKNLNVDIVVLDMPLLDTRVEKNGLVGRFITDLVLQILSFVAQNERDMIKRRQAEGIKSAKERGVKFGRPRIFSVSKFEKIAIDFRSNKLTFNDAVSVSKMSIATFYRYLRNFNALQITH